MKKNIISEETKQQICADYENLVGIENLAYKYHIGKLKVKEILKENGITFRTRNSARILRNFVVSDYRIEKYPEEKGYHYEAVSKDGKIKFNDYMNKGGFLTSYIKKEYGIDTPTLYDRRIYYQTTGNYWWEQWFDIIKVKDKETKKCPYCDWETIDVDNRSGMFLTHLLKEHGITKFQHLEKHPEDRDYFALSNKTKDRKMETDERKFVTCAICGEKFGRIDWRHLSKHNITKREYIEKYGVSSLVSKETHDKLSNTAHEVNKIIKPTWISKAEIEIGNFLKENNIDFISSERKVLAGKEIDIYIPDLKIGIEYNGLFWHKEGMNNKAKNSHLEKLELCKEKNIKLMQIFEDEYYDNKTLVMDKISHILRLNNNLSKIPGRKCTIQEMDIKASKDFLNTYHIQGFGAGTIHLGAYYDNQLIAVMCFKQEVSGGNKWELTRFASDYHYICQGVGGKLFKYFVNNYNPEEIKSFADRRWTVDEKNNIYIQLGFKFDKYTPPDYCYYNAKVDKFHRVHKFNFRKQLLHKRYGFPLTMTESEMVSELGYTKIWNCGLIKYIWKKENNNEER